MTTFEKPEDYDAFLRVLEETWRLVPLPIFAFAVMPNHWHILSGLPEWRLAWKARLAVRRFDAITRITSMRGRWAGSDVGGRRAWRAGCYGGRLPDLALPRFSPR